MLSQKIGGWAFIVGIVVSLLAGIAQTAMGTIPGAAFIPLVLVILGLIVGFLNIEDKDVTSFLVASFTFLAMAVSAAGLSIIPGIGQYLVAIVNDIAVFVAPAAFVVALRAIVKLAGSQ